MVLQDDIAITGRNRKEHLDRLEKVLRLLESSGLKIAREKCKFFEPSIEYLGHIIDSKGIRPSHS